MHTTGRSDIKRLEFWASVISEDPVTFPSDIKLCEVRLMSTFAAQLADHVRAHHRATPSGPYRFKVNPPLTYGSLEINIGIEGVDHLLSAMAWDAQLLLEVLTQYSPEAFVAAIPIPALLPRPVKADYRDTEWLVETAARAGDVHPDGQASIDAEEGPPTQGPAVDDMTSPSRERPSVTSLKGKVGHSLWVLANTSLLVPVGLSLVAIYLAFGALETERDRMERRAREIEKREAALIEAISAREQRMFAAFIARHASPPESSASAAARH